MILLDTNVISALIRQPLDPTVAVYILRQPRGDLLITSVRETEILYSLYRLPARRRQLDLSSYTGSVAGYAGHKGSEGRSG